VKVGHRQTPYKAKRPSITGGAFCFGWLELTYLKSGGRAKIHADRLFQPESKKAVKIKLRPAAKAKHPA
jgi:hypothetical protein